MKQLEFPIDGSLARPGRVTIPEPARTEIVRQMARLLLSLMAMENSKAEEQDSGSE